MLQPFEQRFQHIAQRIEVGDVGVEAMHDAHDAPHQALDVVHIINRIEAPEMRNGMGEQLLHAAPTHGDDGHGITDVLDGLELRGECPKRHQAPALWRNHSGIYG